MPSLWSQWLVKLLTRMTACPGRSRRLPRTVMVSTSRTGLAMPIRCAPIRVAAWRLRQAAIYGLGADGLAVVVAQVAGQRPGADCGAGVGGQVLVEAACHRSSSDEQEPGHAHPGA